MKKYEKTAKNFLQSIAIGEKVWYNKHIWCKKGRF